ncbi:MAG: SprB repeat-containing protein [Bacteroidetes bacterium]|nr:SprB repeat-containing protein [Bacteroidota bacterium]
MKKFLHILSTRSLLLLVMFVLSAAMASAQTPTFSAGFNVYLLEKTYDAGASTTTFTWRVEQTTSLTGLSHMNMANFCLEGSVRNAEYSTDGITWTATTPVYSDGSTPECQSANSLIKFSGKALNNYFKLTLNGRYDAILGDAVLKFGNGNVNNGVGNGFTTTGCSSLQIRVPVKVQNYATVTVCETMGKTKLNATTGADTYTWTAPDGTQKTTTASFLDIDQVPASSGTYRVVYTKAGCRQEDQFVVLVNPAPAVPTVTGAARCGEGVVTLAAQTITSGAVIDWYANATGGTALLTGTGSYSTPTINATTSYYTEAINSTTGCVSLGRTAVTALVNPVPSATATASNVRCKDGTDGAVSLRVSGGTSPYSYAWSNGVQTEQLSDVAAGTYSVTVTDANGCTATASSIITEPALLTATATASNVTCNGGSNGSIDLSVSGGTGSYSYVWSNTASSEDVNGLAAGTYSVTVTDANGCTTTASAVITEPAKISVSATGPGSVCAGSAMSLTATGGVSYQWSGPDGFSSNLQNPTIAGALLTSAGVYTATVTDANGCSNSATVTVLVNECRSNAGIYPTEVNCSLFNSGKAVLLPTVCLTPKTVSGKTTVFNATPGVFFYYTNIVAPAANFSVYVSQTASGALGGAKFSLHQGYVFAFANGCTKIATGAEAATIGDAVINFKNVQPGTVITLAVKYDAKSVVGKPITGILPSRSSFVAKWGNSAAAPAIPNTTTSVSLSNCNGGTILNGSSEPTVNASVKTEQSMVVEDGPAVQVTAFPNPYVSKISFTLRSTVSGMATLELYDMTGRKLAVPFLGTMKAGVAQQVDFTTPSSISGTLIYQFRVGNKTVNGKLMSVR